MWLNVVGIILAIASTMLEILSYMLKYEEEAREHWKAAQMYSEIYRKCQFFYSNYYSYSLDVWREKLLDISEELSRISSLSPSLSEESYAAWAGSAGNKKYPIHKAIKDLKTENIQDVIETIKNELEDYEIEIFLFGSYFTSLHYNDIDIAVILLNEKSKLQLKEKMNAIESKYAVMGLDLDITIISEEDLLDSRFTQFAKNIFSGECCYKSPTVNKSLKENDGTLTNYSEMIQYFVDKAKERVAEKDYQGFVSYAFYMYYHALTSVLQRNNVNWYGERSMIVECEYLALGEKEISNISSDELKNIIKHARLFMDEKNVTYLNGEKGTVTREDFKKMCQYYCDDIGKIAAIAGIDDDIFKETIEEINKFLEKQ